MDFSVLSSQTQKVMKGSRNTNNKQSKQGYSKKPKPEIRDDMDSRENKEMIGRRRKSDWLISSCGKPRRSLLTSGRPT
jgi:hypothetical protein